MKIGYIAKACGRKLSEASVFTEWEGDINGSDLETLIAHACEFAWYHRDGKYWMLGVTTITLVCDGKDLGTFKVDTHSAPHFDISPVS